MKFGVTMFATEYAIRPDDLARELEQRGFESLWIPEHTHIPASRRSPWPGGGDLPKEYWYSYDPFAALTAAAVVTKTLKLGTGICLVIERDPIVTAKEVATVDRLSNGRFIFGIGGGWNAEEMEHHGTPFKTRFRILRERILAMREIWTKDEASYHGQYVNFDRIWSWPKPVQKPLPILMGGDGATTLDRVVEFCDGWMPLVRAGTADLAKKIDTLRERVAKAGRDPKALDITAFAVRRDRGMIDELEKMGVGRSIFMIPSAPREQTLPRLDGFAEVMR